MDLNTGQQQHRTDRLLGESSSRRVAPKKSMVIDRTMIIDMSEEDLYEFICGICHEIFSDPMVTPCCRQTFCNYCITRWLLQQNLCPNDRKPLNSNNLSPAPRVVINLVNNMKVKCKYHKNGCKTVVKVSEIEYHLKDCTYNQCETCGLGRESDIGHNCVHNLKITIDSISEENRRLKIENKRLDDENKVMRKNSEKKPQSSRSMVRQMFRQNNNEVLQNPSKRGFNQRPVLSEKTKNFMSGKFKLVSKYEIEGNTKRDKLSQTTIEFKINDKFIMTRTGLFNYIKEFTLGERFGWIRHDGEHRISIFDFNRNSNSGTRFVEIVYEPNKSYKIHYYELNILNNSFTIEWTVKTIKKVEIYKKIEEYEESGRKCTLQ